MSKIKDAQILQSALLAMLEQNARRNECLAHIVKNLDDIAVQISMLNR